MKTALECLTGLPEGWKSGTENQLLERAYFELFDGELNALAELLKSDAGGLHPHIANLLVAMIEKDGDISDFILETKKHQNLKRKSQSRSSRIRRNFKDRTLALIMASNGGHKPKLYEASIAATIDDTGMRRTAITNSWRKYRKDKEFRVKKSDWLEKLCTEFGGFNAVVDMQEAGDLPLAFPENYSVEDLESKIYASIEDDLSIFHLK